MRYREIFEEARTMPAPLRNDGTVYPEVLSSAHEIANFVVSVQPDYDAESVADEFADCTAVLRLVPASKLRSEQGDHHGRDTAKERAFAKMRPETMPPLLVRSGEIKDGNHRFRVGVAGGQPAFWCYLVKQY